MKITIGLISFFIGAMVLLNSYMKGNQDQKDLIIILIGVSLLMIGGIFSSSFNPKRKESNEDH